MSKKRFTDGLESVFGSDHDETFDRGLLVDEPIEKQQKPAPRRRKSSSRKNFTTDLDSLFDNTLTEVVEEKMGGNTQPKNLEGKSKVSSRTRANRKPLSGLDALIRQTIDSASIEYDPKAKKRVTFVCDRDNLEKLKRIARKEKSYLKDILGEIVDGYIKAYENDKDDSN